MLPIRPFFLKSGNPGGRCVGGPLPRAQTILPFGWVCFSVVCPVFGCVLGPARDVTDSKRCESSGRFFTTDCVAPTSGAVAYFPRQYRPKWTPKEFLEQHNYVSTSTRKGAPWALRLCVASA